MGGAGPSRVISSTGDVPRYQRVLTGPAATGSLRIPKENEYAVVALEIGTKQAVLYYDPTQLQTAKQLIGQVRHALNSDHYRVERERAATFEVLKAIVDQARSTESVGTADAGSASLKLWDTWFAYSAANRATDLHVEIEGLRAKVRVRIDGELELIRDDNRGIYTAQQAENALSAVYHNRTVDGANSNTTFNKSEPQYTMLAAQDVDGKKFSGRFQSLPGFRGPKGVVRLLPADVEIPTLSFSELGYEESHERLFARASAKGSGMVLLTGEVGSGKTTALKTFVETHPSNGRAAIVSLEDPVEYPLKGVHQIQFQRDLSDANSEEERVKQMLGAIVRSDLDGALLGEIRDRVTAQAVLQVAQLGHWVSGTLHAKFISGIVNRLTHKSIGLTREELAAPDILSLLIFQSLVPKLCDCAHRGRAHEKHSVEGQQVHALLDLLESKYKLPAERFRFRNVAGCEKCRQRGTFGLTVVAEAYVPDTKWLELIRNGKDHEAIRHYRSFSDRRFDTPNMDGKTVFEHTLFKAQQGLIDPRLGQRFHDFEQFITEFNHA